MLASYILDSRRGVHGLKRLAAIHLGMYEYDDELERYKAANKEADPDRGGSYAKVPLDILLPYAAKDACATYRLHGYLLEQMTREQLHFYHEVMVPACNTVCDIKANGVAVDDYIAQRYSKVYTAVQTKVYERILHDKMVAKYIDYKSKQGKRFAFNPNSSKQVGEVLYDSRFYGLKPTVSTASGKPSVSKDAIKDLDIPFAKDLRYYRLLTKMLGTYVEPIASGRNVMPDGRIHADYLLHATATGRLASSNPNMQNIPTPEKEPGTLLAYLPIKNMYTNTNGLLVSIDYAGMELRVFASLADCEPMLEIHRSGADFHSMVASMISGKPVEEITKPERYRYKWTNWTLLYGGDAHTLHNLYGLPIEEANETIRQYYDKFPEVLEYRERCAKFLQQHGYIETPFGRRRYINMSGSEAERAKAVREAVNTPVQSAASDITLMALILINHYLQLEGFESFTVNTVHDSIVLDVVPAELEDVAELCVDVMENIALYASEHMPHLDFSWLRAPLRADVDVGTHYGALESYDMEVERWKKLKV